MSPSKFQESDPTKGLMINGSRSSPLKINKDSQVIDKQSSYLSNQAIIDNPRPKHNNLSTKRQPVIIYTHSPKVIHAHAKDFMALVQKLTGLSRDEVKTIKSEPESTKDDEEKDCGGKNVVYEDNESSSLTDDKFIMGEIKQDSSAISPLYNVNNNAYMGDIPLYTPNSKEFFCSSRNSSVFQSEMVNSTTNGFMDWTFPEY